MFSKKILQEKSKWSSSVCQQICSHLTKSYLLITVHFQLPLEIKGAEGVGRRHAHKAKHII